MPDTMELAARRRAELMSEMRRLDAFMQMALQLEREASGWTAASAETCSKADTSADADQPMAGWRSSQREMAQTNGETEAGRAIVKGFKPRTMVSAEPVTVTPSREEAPKREDASMENVFAVG